MYFITSLFTDVHWKEVTKMRLFRNLDWKKEEPNDVVIIIVDTKHSVYTYTWSTKIDNFCWNIWHWFLYQEFLQNEALKMMKPIWRSTLLKYGFVNVKITAATDFYLIHIKMFFCGQMYALVELIKFQLHWKMDLSQTQIGIFSD